MFAVEKIGEDTVSCPRFVAYEGALREDSSSSFNLGQMAKRIHGESDEPDEEEAQQAQCKIDDSGHHFIWSGQQG